MAAEDAAVTVSIRANLKDYEAAMKAAVRATERTAAAAEKLLAGIGKTTRPGAALSETFAKSTGQMANDARVLQFQLNDIFSGLATGQGIRAVQQQLGQIAQQLGGGGLMAAARTMGTAMLGMINPINLAVVAFGLAATAAAAYFGDTEEGAKEAEKAIKKQTDALSKQAETIDKLRKAYGLSSKDITTAVDRMIAWREAVRANVEAANLLAATMATARETFTRALGGRAAAGLEGNVKFAQDFYKALALIDAGKLEEAVEALLALEKTKVPDAMRAVLTAVTDATIGMAKAKQESDELTKTLDEVSTMSAELLKDIQLLAVSTGFGEFAKNAIEALTSVNAALDELGFGIDDFLDAIAAAPGKLLDLSFAMPELERKAVTATGSAALTFLKTRAANKEIADQLDQYGEEALIAFAELFTILPPSARITSAARSFEHQARLRADYLAGRGGLAAPPETGRHVAGRGREPTAIDVGMGVDMATLKAAVEQTGKLETLKDRAYEKDKVHVQLKGTQKKADEDAFRAAERKAEQQATALEQLNEMIATEEQDIALKEKINTINADLTLSEDQRSLAIAKVTAEAAREAEVEKLVNQAREAGLAITPELIAQYQALAQAKVNAILTDKQLAITQRETAKAAADQAEATKQLAQQISSMAQSAISGLVNDLRNGVEAGEAFNNMLNRIIDSLIQMALQSIFSPTGGGGSWLTKLITGVAHEGGIVGKTAFPKRRVSPLVFAGAPRMAAGGLVGGEVPIIAHRGEMIVPKSMVGRGGVGKTTINNQLGPVSIDMSGTGLVAAGADQARQFGENVRKLVAIEMVRESRPGGLLRRVPT